MTRGVRARAAACAPRTTPAPSRRVAWAAALVAAILVAAGCSGRRAAPGASRPTAAGASSSAASVDPCAVARQQRARAPGLLGEGKLHRTLRVLAEADRRCPAERPATWAVEVETLAELGRSEAARELARIIEGDPRATDADRAAARRALALVEERGRAAPDPEALYGEARSAKQAGRFAEAQRLLDRAVSEFERATGAEVTTDAPERRFPASVTWSPDGTLLAVTDGMDVVVREVATLRERVRLGGHGSAVSAVAFSPDGSSLVTGSYDRAVRRFRLRDGAALRTLAELDAPVTAVAFSGDGRTIFSASFSGALRWTRAEDGAALGSLPAPQPYVLTVPSPDGSTVAVVLRDGSLSVRRARDGGVLHDLAGDRLRVASLTFSPDGSTLVVGSADGSLRLWRVRDGAALHRLDQATGSSQTTLALSPDGSLIAVGLSGAVRLLRARDGAVLHDVPAPRRDASVRSVAFSPDGGTLAAGQVDGALLLVRVRDGAVLRTLEGHGEIADAIAFSPDGRTLAAGTYWGAIRLWRARGGSSLRTFPSAPSGVMALAFSPDGRTLASGHDDELVRLWDVEGGVALRALPGHRYRTFAVAFSPDGRILATGSDNDRVVRLFRVADGALLRALPGHEFNTISLAFSPDAGTLLTAASDGTVRSWRVRHGAALLSRRFRDYPVGVAFTRDASRVAVKEHGGTVRIFALSDGSPVRTLAVTDGLSSSALAFSPDGRVLASGSGDGVVHRWRVDDGAPLRTLEVERYREPSVIISPEDASASYGTRETGSVVLSLAFSPDGRTLAATSERGGLRCFSLPDGRLLLVARGITGADAGYVSTPSGHYDFVGAEPDRAEERVLCRFGPLAFPFELCAERFRVPGLLARALGGDESYLEP